MLRTPRSWNPCKPCSRNFGSIPELLAQREKHCGDVASAHNRLGLLEGLKDELTGKSAKHMGDLEAKRLEEVSATST